MKNLNKIFSVIILSIAIIPTKLTVSYAETLQEAVEKVLVSHDRVLAAKADFAASNNRVSEMVANSWAPQFDLTTHIGREAQSNQAGGANTDLVSREMDLKLTQRVLDWGKATADIAASRFSAEQMADGLEIAKQAMILDTVSAFINLLRTQQMVDYAQESINNIKRQGEVEDARVALGKGYSSDVLQVKTQLAGAMARLVQSRGLWLQAKNHIRAVFLRDPAEVVVLEAAPPDFALLPKSAEEAIAIAITANPTGKQLANLTNMLESQIKSLKKSTFYPIVNAILEHKMKDGVSGVAEFERETFGKFEISFPFNLGFSGVEAIRAARKDVEAARKRHNDFLLQITELTNSAWDNLETAKANAVLLNDQADLAAKFLELAREERKLDKRTLLDVLNGETALINSKSDAASAEADVKIAYYTLVQTMGALTIETLAAPATLPSASFKAATAKE